MNKFVKSLVVIIIFLFFSTIQLLIINEQRADIQNVKDTFNIQNLEYTYFNSIVLNSEAIILQERQLAKIENTVKLDFTAIVEDLQQNFQNHGWLITDFQRLEENFTVESDEDDLIVVDSSELVKCKSTSYEMHFVVSNENIVFPLEILKERAENISINSITILINAEKIHGILNITYNQQELDSDFKLEI